jgi:AraC-like DNA-binding protein
MADETAATFLTGARAERTPGPAPDNLPVVLRSASHGTIARGRFRPPWSQRLVMAKWVLDGQAAMRIAGRKIPVGPGQVAVYFPTLPHEFWAVSPTTDMCWYTIDGPLSEPFATLLGLRPGVYAYGPPPPVPQVQAMIASLHDQSPDGRRQSALLAIAALHDLARHVPPPPAVSVVQQVRHLIREGLADPDLCAKGIAAQLGYNRSSLSLAFHRHTGMTIMDYITQTRLQEAELLLSQTADRVGDVARKCGFRDVSYFTRWVRKHTSHLPSQLRTPPP